MIVVGAGHAGCEAALTAARAGAKTLLLTLTLDKIAWQPCNPAVGGPAKSQLVHEIDALGGWMGKIADRTYLQKRVLNKSKGPAVWALRQQTDKLEYSAEMRRTLERCPGLEVGEKAKSEKREEKREKREKRRKEREKSVHHTTLSPPRSILSPCHHVTHTTPTPTHEPLTLTP